MNRIVFTLLILSATVLLLALPLTTNAQLYMEWQVPYNTSFVDKAGNSYSVYYSGDSYLHQIKPTGDTGWTVVTTEGNHETVCLSPLDGGGNIFVAIDSTQSPPQSGYIHVAGYSKYSPDGTLLAQSTVTDLGGDLYRYSAWHERIMDVGVGSAGNMLFAGYTNEVYSGDYVYNPSLILAINDNGLLWKDILEGNHPTWSSGVGYVQIIGGPDVNREFVVEVLFKEQPHPDSTSERWLIKCSPSAGIIWRTLLSYYDYGRELGHSGSIYEYTNDQTFIKEDDEFNTLWTDTLPAGQYFRGFAENPTDNGIIVSLYSSGTFQYECLSADGTTRWMFSLAQGSWGFDLEGHIIIASGLNASVYQIDENDGTVVTASHIPGLVGGRIVPNTLHNLFILNRRHTAKLAPLPDMIPMDANRDALTGQKLYLIRVSGDAPNRTVDTLGIVTTGNDGNRAKTSTVEEMSC